MSNEPTHAERSHKATPDDPIRINSVNYIDGDNIPDYIKCSKCGITYPKQQTLAARKRVFGKPAEYFIFCTPCAINVGILKEGNIIHVDIENKVNEHLKEQIKDPENNGVQVLRYKEPAVN